MVGWWGWVVCLAAVTFSDAPPGQRDVCEEGVERRALLAFVLLPEVEGLREAAHRP